MSAFTVKKTTKRGHPCWVADIPASITGKRVRIFRESEEEAESAAQSYVGEHRLHGSELASLTTQERAFILRLRAKGLTVADAEKSLEDAAKSSLPLSEAVNRYLATQSNNSRTHQRSLKSNLKHFVESFPGRSLSLITTGDLSTYLLGKKGGAVAIFRRLRAFFRWAFIMGLIEKNPMEKVPKPSPDYEEKVIFTPKQMRALLKAAAADPVMLRYLVLGGFYGMRTSEIQRLRLENIDDVHEIHVLRMKTQKKGIRERYIPALPNADAWIKRLNLPREGRAITINDRHFRLHRAKLLERVNQKTPGLVPVWPYNALRRSFGSYHLAAFENPNLTATRMGHTSPETTIAKYQAVRKKAVAVEWFAIMPE